MYDLEISWKSFKIHLGHLAKRLKSIAGPDFSGLSANKDKLIIHFAKQPAQDFINRIQMEINGLTSSTEEAKFKKEESENRAISQSKSNLLLADMSSLLPAERKLLMGLPLTKEDKDAILSKYPQ